MPNPFKNLDDTTRTTLQKVFGVAGGFALLAGVALLAEQASFFNLSGQAAAVVTAQQNFSGLDLSISASSPTSTQINPTTLAINTGESADISWMTTGITLPLSVFNCLGDGVSACGNGNPAQTLNGYNNGSINEPTTFQYAGDWYLVGLDISGSSSLWSFSMYKWMPSGSGGVGCWGDGTTCDEYYQTMPRSSYLPVMVRVALIDGVPVLAVHYQQYVGSSNYDNIRVFKWTNTGHASCPTAGGWGNGASCAANSYLQEYTYPYVNGGKGLSFFNVDTNTFLFSGYYVMKWLPTANGGNGCFGDGTTCASGTVGTSERYQANYPAHVTGVEVVTLASFPQVLSTSPYYLTQPIAIVEYNPATNNFKTKIYPWNPNLNSGKGCFGIEACWGSSYLAYQSAPLVKPYPQFTSATGTYVSAHGASAGGKDYLLISRSASSQIYMRFYQFMPPGTPPSNTFGCIGDGTTCGEPNRVGDYGPVGTLHPLPLESAFKFSEGLDPGDYLTVGNVIRGPTYLGSDLVSVVGGKVLKPTSALCFGGGGECGQPNQSLLDGVSSSNNVRQVKAFTEIGSGNNLLAIADVGTSATPEIFKWMSSCNSGTGGYGDGVNCSSDTATNALQILSNSNGLRSLDAISTDTNTYLVVVEGNSGSVTTKIYKWMSTCNSGQGGFGNGTTCGSTLPNTLPAAFSVKAFSLPGESDTPYVALSSLGATGGVSFYKWTPSLSCFGNGVDSCASAYQTVGSGVTLGPRLNDTFVLGDETYFLLASNNGVGKLYKWTAYTAQNGCPAGGGFGNGLTTAGACGTPYQDINSGIYEYMWKALVVDQSTAFFAAANSNGRSYIYKWTPNTGTGCPSGGGLGDGSASCLVPLQILPYWQGSFSPEEYSAVWINAASQIYVAVSGTGKNIGGGEHVRIWNWMPPGTPASNTGGCFGSGPASGSVCADSTSIEAYTQRLTGVSAFSVEQTLIGSNQFLLTGGAINRLYKYLGGDSTLCTVTATDSSGSSVISSGLEGSFSTGPLTQNTNYTLDCAGVGSVAVQVTVAAGAPTATVTATDATAAEGTSDTGNIRITLDAAPSTNLPITYTVSGTATPGVDYTTLSGTVAVLAGQTTANIVVSAQSFDDSIYEGNEMVIVTLQTPGDSSYTVGSPNQATVTITDNETSTSVPTLSTSNLTVSPALVRKGSPTTVSWTVSNLVTGANGNNGNTCTLSSLPSVSGLPQSWSGTGTTWSGSVNPIIQAQTIFTLTCWAPNGTQSSISKTVTLIPFFEEI